MGQDIEVIVDKNAMREWSRNRRLQGDRICLVPTMGYLHRGHLSLVEEAKTRAPRVVVSIYINPAQFAVGEDFSTYPSNFEGDLDKLRALGVDAVFTPFDLYVREEKEARTRLGAQDNASNGCTSCLEEKAGNGHETWIRVERLEKPLCGKSRPIFFRGVTTVVAKLFNIVEPDIAVFGKKDYQQWRLICRMVRDLDFAVEIIGSEIVRDPDGLALSSRNVHLSLEEREKALSISRSLNQVRDAVCNGEISTGKLRNSVVEAILNAGGKMDYAEIVDQETLQPMDRIDFPAVLCVAAWFGGVRVIDNIELQPPSQ
uniref:Pantoate--beta-alanine ligase n=1 Tax=Wollemia nobilis TaxID=56998 RepID=A0A0C9RQM9_9CONI